MNYLQILLTGNLLNIKKVKIFSSDLSHNRLHKNVCLSSCRVPVPLRISAIVLSVIKNFVNKNNKVIQLRHLFSCSSNISSSMFLEVKTLFSFGRAAEEERSREQAPVLASRHRNKIPETI